ncbi:uclacyanin 1 [Ziziphus jujuba]|uniref:Uclacyanin 1 n=2 Tax=Ziziphus jujuba TaxID=326968 RepID=A0A6P3ZUQ9_ZIZJJ|nr:uclacyanin 1 [Ziziphus jujuba]KAH7529456.1 hypothetical protein FEM48_Zijuj05G0185900 [Ziziphus jujuba var. spinosa]
MVGLRPEWAVKAIVVIIITSILFRCVSAVTNHTVGGVSGWDLTSNLQGWAAETTFRVGDFLVFSYTPVHDVLEVHHLDYHFCHTVHPIRTYNDGETVIQLTQPGPRYFICGRQGHCNMGLRLQVQVLPQLSDNNDNAPTTPTTISPSSSPTASPPSDGGGDQTNRHQNHPSAPPRRAPLIGDRRPPPPARPTPPPPAAPAPSNDAGGEIEVPSIGSENGPQDKPNNPANATSASPPCTCGAGEVVISLLFWWFPVITALVMLVSSWSIRELGFLFGISHLVIV